MESIDIINTLQSHFTSDDAAFATFINAPNRAGNTSLHWAALNGHLAVVQSLVKCGGDPSKTNNAGHDVVFEAEQNDKEAVVKWLLKEVPGLERAIGGSGNEAEGEVEGEVIGNGEEVEEENVDGISGAVVDGDVDMG